MGRAYPIELTNMCMLTRADGKVLVQNRRDPNWGGLTFPGGHVEPGEAFTDSVVREVFEETGLTIHDPRLCGVKQFPISGGRYLVFLYKTDSFEGELCSSEEGQMEWVARSNLLGVPIVSDFMELLAVFDREALSEFQYVEDGSRWNIVLK